MDHISEAISEIKNENYRPTLPRPQMPEQESGLMLRTKPPLVRPEKMPKEIMAEHLDYADMEAMIGYLSDHQKTESDWNTFRRKIPNPLLDKWAAIMRECRANGFVAPFVENNEIRWRQILSTKRNHDMTDKCTLCTNLYIAGKCRGQRKLKATGMFFVPCWGR